MLRRICLSLFFCFSNGEPKEQMREINLGIWGQVIYLIAMSRDTFIIEGLIYFRLRFEFDRQGRATAIVGMHERGNQDRTTRDKL